MRKCACPTFRTLALISCLRLDSQRRNLREDDAMMKREAKAMEEIMEIWDRYPSLRAQLLAYARELEAAHAQRDQEQKEFE